MDKDLQDEEFVADFGKLLLDQPHFLKICKEYGLVVSEEKLSFYIQEQVMSPIVVIDGESFYSTFQIFRVFVIEKIIHSYIDRMVFSRTTEGDLLQETSIDLKKILSAYKEGDRFRDDIQRKMIKILHYLQPIFWNSVIITPFMTRFGFDRSDELSVWQVKMQTKNVLEDILSKHEVDIELIALWQKEYAVAASLIDPIEPWYHFVQNVGKYDTKKVEKLKGTALLAQLFYKMEFILRNTLKIIDLDDNGKEKVILNPHDIRDGSGGSWRIARDENGVEIPCCKCGKVPIILNTFDALHHGDKFLCKDCQIEFILEMAKKADQLTKQKDIYQEKSQKLENIPALTPLICKSSKCENNDKPTVLLKGLHEGIIVEKTNAGLLVIESPYGQLNIAVKCQNCGKVTSRNIRTGWDLS